MVPQCNLKVMLSELVHCIALHCIAIILVGAGGAAGGAGGATHVCLGTSRFGQIS